MKKINVIMMSLLLLGSVVSAAPLRVALLDFDGRTVTRGDPKLSGAVNPESLAEKGVFVLGKELLGSDRYVLIDRRDFISQIENTAALDNKRISNARPSFIHAAQALNADVVLRGILMSLSTGKQIVRQGGYNTDLSTVSLRVSIEALDVRDGAVIALAEGVARSQFRITDEMETVLGEDDILTLLDKAVSSAMPDLGAALDQYVAAQQARERIKLSISTDADPALVEIDGILVGSTPVDGLDVYKGDHILTVGKPGFRDVTKTILFEKDSKVTIPMFRTELTADELKEVIDGMRINAFVGVEPAIVVETIQQAVE